MSNKMDALVDVRSGYRVTQVINDNSRKIEQALENTVSLDGSTPNEMGAPLSLGNHKLINVAAGTTASDAVTKAQLDSFGSSLTSEVIDQIATRVVQVINEGGGGVITPPTGGYTDPPAPTAVSTGTVLYNSVPISWTMSSTTWAEGYNITRNGLFLVNIRGGATLTYTDSTVQPNQPYTYAISAYNDTYAYDSAYTAATQITTPSAPSVAPGTPTNVTATEVSPGVVSTTWEYTSLNPVNSFLIVRDGSNYAFTTDSTARQFTDDPVDAVAHGRTPVSVGTHTYAVKGFLNTYGQGPVSTAATVVVTQASAGVPPAPTGVIVVPMSSTQLRTDWTFSSNLHDGFVIEVQGPDGYYNQLIITDKAARSYMISGLIPSTTYQIVVMSFTVVGASVSTYPSSSQTGTTSSGTVVTTLAFDPSTDYSLVGQIGVDFSTTTTPIATVGGISGATILFTLFSGMPSWMGLNLYTGAWVGAAGSLTATTNQQVVVAITDGVSVVLGTFSLTIVPSTMVVTPPSGVVPNGVIAATGGVAFTKTWSVAGGTAPYAVIQNGVLPTGLVTTGSSSTSLVISGTPTQDFSSTNPINVNITSTDGQSFDVDYTIQYTTDATVNNPPVFGTLVTPQTFTEGTQYNTMNTITATDPDVGDTVTLKLESVTTGLGSTITPSYASGVDTVPGGVINVTFTRATGVLEGDYAEGAGDYGTPFTYNFSADDSVADTLTAAHNIPTQYTVGVSAIPSGVGITSTGGTAPIVYTLASGTMPTWLGNAVTAGTGVITGATGAITAGVTPFVLRATDNAAVVRDVSVTITALAASANDFSSRVAGTLFACNMEDVYVNGILQSGRTIVDSGSNGAGATHLKGEFYGSNNSAQITLVDDPTGWQTQVAQIQLTAAQTQGGTLDHRIDGGITSGLSTGTVYSRFYTMFSFFGDRNIFAYRDPTTDGQMKLGTLGTGFVTGEVVLTINKFTGFFKLSVDSDNSQAASLWNAVGPDSYTPHVIPIPNPWGSSTSSGRIRQFSGQWAPNAVGTPPATADGKLAYYTYYGALEGSSVGMPVDMTGLGVIGVDSGGNETPWLDERVHAVGGTTVTWPMTEAATNTAKVGIDQQNYIQLFFEREADGYGTAGAWHCVPGETPKVIALGAPRSIYWGSDANAVISHRIFGALNYDTLRGTDVNRPTQNLLIGETVSSLSPIKFPGGSLPPFNYG